MKKIAVVAAMEEELEKIQALMKKKKIYKISGRKFIRGKFSGKTIVAVICGIGKVNCAVTVQILIDKFKVKNILNFLFHRCPLLFLQLRKFAGVSQGNYARVLRR